MGLATDTPSRGEWATWTVPELVGLSTGSAPWIDATKTRAKNGTAPANRRAKFNHVNELSVEIGASGRTAVRAIAAIPSRARNRHHRTDRRLRSALPTQIAGQRIALLTLAMSGVVSDAARFLCAKLAANSPPFCRNNFTTKNLQAIQNWEESSWTNALSALSPPSSSLLTGR
jgi:hypothetical protein